MRALALILLLLGPLSGARAQVVIVTNTDGSAVVVSGAQTLPAGADIEQVARALAILRGRPAIVPLAEAANDPTPTPVPVATAPPVTPLLSEPPIPVPLTAPAMGVRVRRSFPFGSIDSVPRNLGINKGF